MVSVPLILANMMPGVVVRGGVALAREVTGSSGSEDLECTHRPTSFAGAKSM